MKKSITIAFICAAPALASAQAGNFIRSMEAFQIGSMIFTVGLFMLFILAILKRWLDYRLKSRIVERGLPEGMATSLLQTNPREDRNTSLKWFALSTGLGAGLTIVHYTQPLGIHSLAIMAFSIAASFLGYSMFTRATEK